MKHTITVDRFYSTENETISTFVCGTLGIIGFGVEDEYRDTKVKGETRISAGEYEFYLAHSPKFSPSFFADSKGNLISKKDFATLREIEKQKYKQHLCLYLKDVQNFVGIIWHWGNTEKDTDGCYVVGSERAVFNGQQGVAKSILKYMEIYPKIFQALQRGEKVFAKYIDSDTKKLL